MHYRINTGITKKGVSITAVLLALVGLAFSMSRLNAGIIASAAGVDDFVVTVQTDNTGPSTDLQFTIPTAPSLTYNYTVDCDNDTVLDLTGQTGDATCVYVTAGTYTIRINGTFPKIYFNNSGDREKILSVEQWGTSVLSGMSASFFGASNLVINATDAPDLSSSSDLSQAFRGAVLVNSNVNTWDVSTIQNFSGLFRDATAFNVDISGWTTTAATNMQSLFRGTFFDYDISGWDVSGVTNMTSLFYGNTAFNQPIGAWGADMADVIDFDFMFFGATAFNQPLSAWVITAAADTNNMFRGATIFNQDITGWDTNGILDMSGMFMQTGAFNQDITGWDITTVTSMSLMFRQATAFNQPIGAWGADMNGVLSINRMFYFSTAFNQDLSAWDTSTIADMNGVFDGATAFNQDLSSWDFSASTNMTDFIDGTAISPENYDTLLVELDTQTLTSGLTFGANGLSYCAGAAARSSVVISDLWTFDGDSLVCLPADPSAAPDLQATSDSGSSIIDDYTSNTTPAFDVECTEITATINLYSNNPSANTQIGTHVCAGVAIEAVVVSPAIAAGIHTVTYTNENVSGESAASPGLVVVIDTAAPGTPAAPDLQAASDTGLSDTDNDTTDSTPTFDVVCTVTGATITLYTNQPSVSTTAGIYVCVGAGTEMVTASPALGTATHSFTYSETDLAGNESLQSSALPVVLSTGVPGPPIPVDLQAASDLGASNTDNNTSDNTPSFNVTCTTVGFTMTVYSDIPSVNSVIASHVCSGVGTETATVPSPIMDAVHNITVTQTDLLSSESPHSSALAVTINTAVAGDDDGDGVMNTVEDAAAPGGDGNGDNILDSLQGSVTSVANSESNAYTTLVTTGCTSISRFDIVAETSLNSQDESFEYPVGLNDFTIQCASPGDSANVVVYYDKVYDTTDWTFRKYNTNGSVFSDISADVTYGTETVNGASVTTASYMIIDGGIYDDDGIANGIIVDPAGPAVAVEELLSNTGLPASVVVISGAVIMLFAMAVSRHPNRIYSYRS